jgi:hypothetical protein
VKNKFLIGLFSVVMLALPATAGPVFIGAFVGTTTINFESFASGTLIDTQLTASDGITFSSALGGIYANSGYAAPMGSPMSATSFVPSFCPCVDVTFSWSAPITALGFQLYTNGGTTTFHLPGGDLLAATAAPAYYYLGDVAGFSTLTISAPVNSAFVIDNITYNGGPAVPEPSTLALVGSGAIAFVAFRRRKALSAR